GWALVAHGLDQTATGLQTAFTGQHKFTVSEMLLQKTGMPTNTASLVNNGISMLGTMGGGAMLQGGRTAVRLSSADLAYWSENSMDLVRKVGASGENAVGISGNKVRIPSLTSTAQYRIPDQLTSSVLVEVKNVNKLALTNQIKDFLLYSQQTTRQLIIYARPDTTFTKPVQQLIDQGLIVIKPIPLK
ncbi:MAG: putative toxin, partial [Chlamydiales bacterium]|nr:putative toxin [Chlamydiales bacterium]